MLKQRLDKSPIHAKTTCFSSAFLKLAQSQGSTKWDPSIKRRTVQRTLFSFSALKSAPSHTGTWLWSKKYCAQHTCILLRVGESKTIPSSYSTLTTYPYIKDRSRCMYTKEHYSAQLHTGTAHQFRYMLFFFRTKC